MTTKLQLSFRKINIERELFYPQIGGIQHKKTPSAKFNAMGAYRYDYLFVSQIAFTSAQSEANRVPHRPSQLLR